MAGILFLLGSIVGAWLTSTALRRFRANRIGPWPLALIAGEMPLHHIFWQAVLSALWIWLGALETWPGRVALVLTILSWVGLVMLWWWSFHARASVHDALSQGLGDDYHRTGGGSPVPWRRLVRPIPRLPKSVDLRSGLSYGPGPRQVLDVMARPDRERGAPVLLQVHGGGWMRGRHDRQARPVRHHLAENGWVCVAPSYRVSPDATFPDHLVDLKRVMGWIQDEGRRRGWATDFVAVTGGSAGGHLAALLALTQNDPAYQPGFEEVDTSIAACVPLYGIFDLQRRDGGPLWPFLESAVMKVSVDEDPAAWHAASPIHRVSEAAPPFFVIHGSRDSLARPEGSQRFVAALGSVSATPVGYAEIPGGTHGLDYFNSIRSKAVVEGIGSFLDAIRSGRSVPRAITPDSSSPAGRPGSWLRRR